MPERIDPRKLRAKVPAAQTEPPLELHRAQASPSRSTELAAAIASGREAAAGMTRLAPELTPALDRLSRAIGLAAAPAPVLTDTLSGPGATIRLSLDTNCRVNCFNPEHVYRSASGQGSYVHLRRFTSTDYSGYVSFWATLPPGSTGVFLAIIHVEGNIDEVKLEVATLPDGGGFYASSKRSSAKFLVPFELTRPTDGLCFGITFPPELVGELKIYSVDISKVT